jgi:arylsulfatase A-like enzyme
LGVLALTFIGTTSGRGGVLALFGVFRREELDLVPVLHLALLASVGVGAAIVIPRFGSTVGIALLVFSLFGLAAGVRGASRAEFRELLTVERERGLSAWGLSAMRRITDRDGDGFSAQFGGGDCNDERKEIYPGARDYPENGVDEDCSGADAKPPKVVEETTKSEAEANHRLPEQANFLLLTVDTLRWDLGYARAEGAPKLSPHLDEFSRRSTVFRNAVALASYTSKSLAPMMLGRYASETHRSFEHFDRFGKEVPFVQEILRAEGIKTISVQGYWYFFFKSYGFERGWDILDTKAAPKHVVIDGDKSSNGHLLAERTIEQLGALAASKERFFLWTHWVDPHAEYVPHEEFDFGSSSRQRYDGEVAFVDAQIGRVLAALEENGLATNTIVMVTSDHGEAFAEHGMIRHGFEVWEELVRVPLLLHIPGVPAREVTQRRSLIDVTATILTSFGLKPPRSSEKFVRGTSLTEDALTSSDSKLETRPVLVDMPEGPHNRERRAFYSGDLKLITSGGQVLGLYDLSKDPAEKEDLSEDKEKVAPILKEMTTTFEGLQQIPARR